MKLRQSRKRHSASDGKITSHGFCASTVRASLIMLPHDGVGGLTERPRNASAPSRVTTVAMPMRRNEMRDRRDVGQELLHQDSPVGRALHLRRDDVVLGGDAIVAVRMTR